MTSNDDRGESASIDSTGRTAIPPAFYRDAPPPTPPRDDPHWVEFYPADASDTLPEWLLWALPLGLVGVMVLHGVLAVVLLLLFRR